MASHLVSDGFPGLDWHRLDTRNDLGVRADSETQAHDRPRGPEPRRRQMIYKHLTVPERPMQHCDCFYLVLARNSEFNY